MYSGNKVEEQRKINKEVKEKLNTLKDEIAEQISEEDAESEEEKDTEIVIKNVKDVLSIVYDIRGKKKENLVCLYLNARNTLIKKELISIGLLNKTLIHPREIFYPATVLNSASIILVHNHPSGNPLPSEKDHEIIEKIVHAGEIMGIPVIDFIIISENDHYSFYENINSPKRNFDYVADGIQLSLFDLFEIEEPVYEVNIQKINKRTEP
jgi:DNA repair protein RadC